MTDFSGLLCDYGCGQIATHRFKNGKLCCSERTTQCPNKKTTGNRAWNKGLTKEDERVKNYSKSMKKTKIKQSRNKELLAWNKGLTKETNSIVFNYSINISKAKKGKPNYKKRKVINKSIDLTISQFKQILNNRLYTVWALPVLQRDNFKCKICGSTLKLEVHHKKKRSFIFNESVRLNLLDLNDYENWSNNDFYNVERTFVSFHSLRIGITLCKKCHIKIDNERRRFVK